MKIFSRLQGASLFAPQLKKKLSVQQIHFICRQLSFALAGGMPLPAALLLVGTEMPQALCRQFLLQLAQAVQEGQSMGQALGQAQIGFSPVLLEFVLAGEQNGAMQETLTQAADYFQQQHHIRQMLFSALFYPLVLLILMIAAFSAMFLLVVPTVVQTYDNFQAELPFLTRGILLFSAWLQHNWAILLAIGLFRLRFAMAIKASLTTATKAGESKRIFAADSVCGTALSAILVYSNWAGFGTDAFQRDAACFLPAGDRTNLPAQPVFCGTAADNAGVGCGLFF